jgi:hypothetical protein
MRFLRRKDIQGSFPYVFPFEGKISGKAILKVDLPNKTMVSPEIFSDEGNLIERFPQKELPAGLHSIELDLTRIKSGVYELKIRFSNQTSRIKIEVEH